MVNISKLKQLREETGISFSLCKKALEETKNNVEEAKKKLQEWGIEKASEKSSRITSQGGIFSYVHHNKKIASLVELQSETDFVSGNAEFQKLGVEIAMQVATFRAADVEELMKQEYIRDAGKTIEQLVKDAVLKFGENIKVSRIARWQLGE
ncbi:MAG: elongation factor Ts [bacterium]|nr:elongation factor Ts [bacterium]